MNPVHLNRLLTLEQPVSTPDSAGGFSTVWQGIGTLWAEITPGTGRGTSGEEVSMASVPYRITLRGAASGSPRRPLPGQRLTDGGRVFQVLAVTERDAAGQYLTCFAREETPA
ncbi:head-tail adaptor protein [Pseudotabrizicola alkalilacus]|uniref:Head-tail adaptor protein n=1 Tax=Pseudotabrizicola alkalilacus TaxID=2305252 RepID=A0A411Z193_9RHOB|nr:head-tail adaptor protein [Pseudotabrizicola alkalilacus]RGP36823.1 head-tail adaptor protein [Pseudotabrizicola alkalilacus]